MDREEGEKCNSKFLLNTYREVDFFLLLLRPPLRPSPLVSNTSPLRRLMRLLYFIHRVELSHSRIFCSEFCSLALAFPFPFSVILDCMVA